MNCPGCFMCCPVENYARDRAKMQIQVGEALTPNQSVRNHWTDAACFVLPYRSNSKPLPFDQRTVSMYESRGVNWDVLLKHVAGLTICDGSKTQPARLSFLLPLVFGGERLTEADLKVEVPQP